VLERTAGQSLQRTRFAMASFRQINANRRNALNSTGPRTDEGKQRSRRNAVRHGLTAETVIAVLEDAEDYKGFELSVTSGFDAQTAVERELVLRLASLLWRLRRATAIETGLLQIQTEILREARQARKSQSPQSYERGLKTISWFDDCHNNPPHVGPDGASHDDRSSVAYNTEIGRCFLRLANLDNGAFERLSRYETALWRQVGQLLFTLGSVRRPG
jgi:hypothetical protein